MSWGSTPQKRISNRYRFRDEDREFYVSGFSRMDTLNHSERCDELFSKLSDVPGGETHTQCPCWCHNEVFDNNERPEYTMEAPDHAIHVTLAEREQDAVDGEIAAELARAEYANGVPEVFSNAPEDPLCELCDDPMSICECVE